MTTPTTLWNRIRHRVPFVLRGIHIQSTDKSSIIHLLARVGKKKSRDSFPVVVLLHPQDYANHSLRLKSQCSEDYSPFWIFILHYIFVIFYSKKLPFNPHTLVSSSGLGGRVMEACLVINTKPVNQDFHRGFFARAFMLCLNLYSPCISFIISGQQLLCCLITFSSCSTLICFPLMIVKD